MEEWKEGKERRRFYFVEGSWNFQSGDEKLCWLEKIESKWA